MGFLLSLHSTYHPGCSQLHARSSAPFVPMLAYNWICSWSTLSHIGALEATISLWSKRGHCCLQGFWLPRVSLPQPLPPPPRFCSGNLCSFKTLENLYSSLFSVQGTLEFQGTPTEGWWGQRKSHPWLPLWHMGEQTQPCNVFEPVQCKHLNDSEIWS